MMKKIEIILWSLLLSIIVIRMFFHIPFYWIPLIGLSLISLYTLFAPTLIQKQWSDFRTGDVRTIISIVSLGLLYSIMITGIIFKALAFPGSQFFLIVGILSLGFRLASYRFQTDRSNSEHGSYTTRLRMKTSIILTLGIVFFFTSLLPKDIQKCLYPHRKGHRIIHQENQSLSTRTRQSDK